MRRTVLHDLKQLQIEIIRKTLKPGHDHNGPKSIIQFNIIKYLCDNKDKAIFQKDLEMATNIRKSSLSGILNTMERNNIISRISIDNDARKKQIVLTEECLKKQREIKKQMKRANEQIITGIANEKLEVFYEVVDKMIENVKSSNL